MSAGGIVVLACFSQFAAFDAALLASSLRASGDASAATPTYDWGVQYC